jgi:hypothetical protein
MHRAFGGDGLEARDLFLAQSGRKSQVELEQGRALAIGLLILALDLHVADLPTLALGVHLDRDRRAGGETRREQLLWRRTAVLAALFGGLVGNQVVPSGLDPMSPAV